MSKEWQFYDYDFGVSDYSGEDLSRLLETVDCLSGCDGRTDLSDGSGNANAQPAQGSVGDSVGSLRASDGGLQESTEASRPERAGTEGSDSSCRDGDTLAPRRSMSAMTCGCDFECIPKVHYCDDYPSCVGGRYLSGYYGSWMPAQARTQQMEDHGRETGFGYPRTETGWVCEPKRVGAEGEKLNPIVLAKTAPSRASTFPKDAAGRKCTPVGTGVLDYFPDAMIAIAQVSYAGNEQHNPGQPLHWDRSKSVDESDAMMRHYLQRGQWDSDGQRHSAKLAWRALALLQKEIEAEQPK